MSKAIVLWGALAASVATIAFRAGSFAAPEENIAPRAVPGKL
jgi:hypothetical protein